VDCYGPILAAGRHHKYTLCITDAFTEYALVTPIENKEAETIEKPVFQNGFVYLVYQLKFTLMDRKSLS
jgi:hypothetical protein